MNDKSLRPNVTVEEDYPPFKKVDTNDFGDHHKRQIVHLNPEKQMEVLEEVLRCLPDEGLQKAMSMGFWESQRRGLGTVISEVDRKERQRQASLAFNANVIFLTVVAFTIGSATCSLLIAGQASIQLLTLSGSSISMISWRLFQLYRDTNRRWDNSVSISSFAKPPYKTPVINSEQLREQRNRKAF